MLMQIQVQCYYKVHMLIAKTTTLLLKITRIKEKNTEMILQSKAVKGKITTILQQSITEKRNITAMLLQSARVTPVVLWVRRLSTISSAAVKSKLGIHTLHIHPDVPKK